MSIRKTILSTGQFYHVYNRGINKSNVFFSQTDFKRFYNTLNYYKNSKPQLRYSEYLKLNAALMLEYITNLNKGEKLVEIHAYCLMDNHFHLLIKQTGDNGLSRFMANITNSYTKYINTRKNRTGPLFTGAFKVVRVTSQEQLTHLSRYIHLNPVEAHITTLPKLSDYKYSSYNTYTSNTNDSLVTKDLISGVFETQENYKNFVCGDIKLCMDQISDAHYEIEK